MPLMDAPEWVDRTLVNLAIALSVGAGVTWIVLVLPDPRPLVALPVVAGVPPAIWLTLVLFLLCYPIVRWFRSENPRATPFISPFDEK